MSNVAAAARDAGSLKHLVRLIGDPPGLDREEHVAKVLRDFEGGTAVQHLRARKVLDDSGLPVTYLNIAAWFMDDFATFMLPPILTKREERPMPYDRWMNFIDCRDTTAPPHSCCSRATTITTIRPTTWTTAWT